MGTIQGNIIGPYLFSIFLNDLSISIGEESIGFKNVGDWRTVATVFKNNDLGAGIVNKFLEWSSSNLMQYNPSKCNELVFQRERHRDEMSNIQECSKFTVSGINFQ